jgi:hypothetical protein
VDEFINQLLERISDYLADRPGLLPLLGVFFVLLNFIVIAIFGSEHWLAESNLFLHIGIVVGIIGLLLIRPLD